MDARMADVDAMDSAVDYPVRVMARPALDERNRLTTAFRIFLAIPHIILVGGPIAAFHTLGWSLGSGWNWEWGSGSGVLGALAALVAVIAWFAIIFTGREPGDLYKLRSYYMRWRVRAVSYFMLLRDEYPPFGDEAYPIELELAEQAEDRNRLTVAFRILLALPHIFILGLLGAVWAFTTALAWIMIIVTGRYPETLYGFALGVFAWTIRVEAYVLLLRDEYPPFTLRA